MQSSAADGGAGQEDRLQLGYWGNRAGPPDLELDGGERGLGPPGRELVGHLPSGTLGGGAEATLLIDRVDLEHDSVDLVRELIPLLLEAMVEVEDRVQVGAVRGCRVHRHAPIT